MDRSAAAATSQTIASETSDHAPALVAAALAGGATEAVQAVFAALRAHADGPVAIAAGAEAFGLLAFPGVLVALAVGAALRQNDLRRFLARAPALIGGGDSPMHAGVGLVLGHASLASAAVVGGTVGRRLGNVVSVNVGASITTITVLLTLCASALLAVWLAPLVSARATTIAVRLEDAKIPIRAVALGISALVLVAALGRLLPRELLATATVAALGFVVVASPQTKPAPVRVFGSGRIGMALALLIVGSALAFPAFAHLPSVARAIILHRTPFAGAVVLGMRAVVDRDRDGYSPILAGGDCNDRDAHVHPGAHDIPANGVDENCSGSDAMPFMPMAPPSAPRPSGVPERPNFLLVQVDALRPDHLGFAGYRRPTSPNIDRFREHATWFRRTYTPAPSTRFAMSALFTGEDVERIPQRRGPGLDYEMVPGGPATFAESLGELGYDRVGYTISYVLQHISGVGRGFRIWETPWPVDDWQKTYPTAATLTTDSALTYLRGQRGDSASPYMLFLHYRCTHDPYVGSDRFPFGDTVIDSYDSAIAYCDDEIGRLLRDVEARDDAKRTVIVLFSDHGELFGEHGFENHGNTLYEPDVRSLLLARIPGLDVSTVDAPVWLSDLAPTVRTLAGAKLDESQARNRTTWDLLPIIERARDRGDRGRESERPLFLYADLLKGTTHRLSRAVVRGRFKYLRDTSTGATALFDVVADPAERSDLGATLPRERAELEELLEGWEASIRPHSSAGAPAR